VKGLIGNVVALQHAVDNLETAMGREFDAHPKVPTLCSVPGLRPVIAARVLGEIGDDT
jgi:hypothetical protein